MSNKKSQKNSVTNEELSRCNMFCEKDYPRIYDDNDYKQKRIKELKSLRTLFNGKLMYTNKDIPKALQEDREYSKKTCKKMYCNPNCGKEKGLRYVSDDARKNFNHLKGRGAITACSSDKLVEVLKKIKPFNHRNTNHKNHRNTNKKR